MNDKGKGLGLALLLILIVALIVAYLAMTQMSSFGFGGKTPHKQQEDVVEHAREAVDAINDRVQRQYSAID